MVAFVDFAIDPAKTQGFVHRLIVINALCWAFFVVNNQPNALFSGVVLGKPCAPIGSAWGVVGFDAVFFHDEFE